MKLWQVAKLIRSKNAGPFELTFDVILKDRKTYEKVRDAKVINAEWFARTYRLRPEVVSIINYDAASAIKITIPRPTLLLRPFAMVVPARDRRFRRRTEGWCRSPPVPRPLLCHRLSHTGPPRR